MTDTKQLEERDKFKAYFEQNLLDGDKLSDSGHTMLSADEVFEVVSEYITAAETAARIDELDKLHDWAIEMYEPNSGGRMVVIEIDDRKEHLQNQTGGSAE